MNDFQKPLAPTDIARVGLLVGEAECGADARGAVDPRRYSLAWRRRGGRARAAARAQPCRNTPTRWATARSRRHPVSTRGRGRYVPPHTRHTTRCNVAGAGDDNEDDDSGDATGGGEEEEDGGGGGEETTTRTRAAAATTRREA